MRYFCFLAFWMSMSAAAAPQVIRGEQPSDQARGLVFHDVNGDGLYQAEEPGVAGVLVSNGLDVVRSDEQGGYTLPWRSDMDLFVVQPATWRVAQDHMGLPQFHYSHRPEGTLSRLRYGGLTATGPAPQAVNFPLYPRASEAASFRCAIIGDSQTYSHDEIGFFRDSTVADLLQQGLSSNDCLIYVGDVVGDNLDLFGRLFDVASVVGVTQWPVIGNHDLDLDAQQPWDASASWRDRVAPAYYAFEIGVYTFVALNNNYFPCVQDDELEPGHGQCGDPNRPTYNGRVDALQMQWLANLLDALPAERPIVLLHHIPFVSITNSRTQQHQTDNALDIYRLLEGRQALSLSGHTHSLENLSPGEAYQGWRELMGIERLPFRHLIAGAASGAWWKGDFDSYGVPMAMMRMGAPRGVLMVNFTANGYQERYLGSRLDSQRVHWVDFSTPDFRQAMTRLLAWQRQPRGERGAPPLGVHDIDDTRLFTRRDLLRGVDLMVNVWLGSAETRVIARINNGEWVGLARSQQGNGGGVKDGVDQIDPFSAKRQISVARNAIPSQYGTGYESFQGRRSNPTPEPMDRFYTRNAHLWRLRLPSDLPVGSHTVTVRITDRHGEVTQEVVPFEVRAERPYRFWQQPEVMEADGS
jgi:3',5'-cyclic AMP phosphodiesterase CpdA